MIGKVSKQFAAPDSRLSMMKNNRFKAALAGLLLASAVSIPLSTVFVTSSNAQDLARIDQLLDRYQVQVAAQSGQELRAALLASQLAGEQLSVAFKTLDDQLVEIGEPAEQLAALPNDADLTAASTKAVTVQFSAVDQVRIRTVKLTDGEFIIFSATLRDHQALAAQNQLIQALTILVAGAFGATAGLLTSRYQASRVRLATLERELELERKSQESMRTFLGDVAHDLKTPLTVIRGYSEMLAADNTETESSLSKPVQRISAEVVRMERLLGELLRMAEFKEVAGAQSTAVDLVSLLQAQADDLGALQRGRKIQLELAAPAKIQAPQLLVEMLFNNIFSNIRKHTDFDSAVAVSLTQVGQHYVITIEDSGTGLPAGLVENGELRVKRFTELRNRGVEGQGLGLAIIKDLTETLDGQITFGTSERLGGLKIELRLKKTAQN
jgi:signal transduction histidine kinase